MKALSIFRRLGPSRPSPADIRAEHERRAESKASARSAEAAARDAQAELLRMMEAVIRTGLPPDDRKERV